jgi:hypothetical protein
MNEPRYVLKDIADGIRELTEAERRFASDALAYQTSRAHMGDKLVPDRTLLAPKGSVTARILESVFGLEGARHGRWSEEDFDNFFEKYLVGGCYLWIEPFDSFERKPEILFWAPYSPARRDWLYVYASECGMRPCGMTRVDGRLSLLANLDCDFTYVFGDRDLIEEFDLAFGGRDSICKDLWSFLRANLGDDFDQNDAYRFMKDYLPKIAGCEQVAE